MYQRKLSDEKIIKNEKLWNEVKEYIGKHYVTEETEKIYFQSDGGAWMKKGIETLEAYFVLLQVSISNQIFEKIFFKENYCMGIFITKLFFRI